jgi:hypothetical protein
MARCDAFPRLTNFALGLLYLHLGQYLISDKILVLDASAKYHLRQPGRSHQATLAHRAQLSGAEAGGRARAFRRARMARLPPSRHTLHRGLRIPDLRKGDDSPLSTSFHRDVPGACHSRRLQTQRLHRCGPSGTFQTRLRPCADGSFLPSSKTCRDVRAAPLRSGTWRSTKLYDAVRLAACRT